MKTTIFENQKRFASSPRAPYAIDSTHIVLRSTLFSLWWTDSLDNYYLSYVSLWVLHLDSILLF